MLIIGAISMGEGISFRWGKLSRNFVDPDSISSKAAGNRRGVQVSVTMILVGIFSEP
jgi:hypothetical protein